jgi:hypothetical protein
MTLMPFNEEAIVYRNKTLEVEEVQVVQVKLLRSRGPWIHSAAGNHVYKID